MGNSNNDLFTILIYIIGVLITYYVTYKHTYKLYLKSNLKNKRSYYKWINDTDWFGVFLLMVIIWPLILILLILYNIYHYGRSIKKILR
jgi:ribose/xylose/arabinose/galactoside ABC-type transport system permease subunit